MLTLPISHVWLGPVVMQWLYMARLSNPFVVRYQKYIFNYIPEKRKFSGILCFRQQRSRAVRRRRRRVTISLLAR